MGWKIKPSFQDFKHHRNHYPPIRWIQEIVYQNRIPPTEVSSSHHSHSELASGFSDWVASKMVIWVCAFFIRRNASYFWSEKSNASYLAVRRLGHEVNWFEWAPHRTAPHRWSIQAFTFVYWEVIWGVNACNRMPRFHEIMGKSEFEWSKWNGMEWMYAFKLYPRPRSRSPIQQLQTSAFRLWSPSSRWSHFFVVLSKMQIMQAKLETVGRWLLRVD